MSGARVHFINRFFYPDHSATSQMVTGVAFDLAAAGNEVHITTSRQLYGDPDAGLPEFEIARDVTIHRLPTTRFGRSGLIGRAIDYASFYLTAAAHLLRVVRRGDVVIAKTDPPLLSAVVAPVAWLKGAVYVNWLQDVFPEVAAAAGIGGKWGRFLFSLLRPLRNWSLRLAAINIAIGERMAAHLAGEGVPPEKVVVLPNWADGDDISPMPTAASPLRKAWDLENKIVVAYSGNLGRVHEVSTLIGAISDIAQRTSEPVARQIVFLFIGSGMMRGLVEKAVSEQGLTNVRLLPYQPSARLSETLAVADIHLVTLLPEMEGLVVPSKLYGILAAGRPAIFVGASDSEVADVLRRHGSGLAVPAGEPRTLANSILALAGSPDERARMGHAGREGFEANYTRRRAFLGWHALLARLTKRASLHAIETPAPNLSETPDPRQPPVAAARQTQLRPE